MSKILSWYDLTAFTSISIGLYNRPQVFLTPAVPPVLGCCNVLTSARARVAWVVFAAVDICQYLQNIARHEQTNTNARDVVGCLPLPGGGAKQVERRE